MKRALDLLYKPPQFKKVAELRERDGSSVIAEEEHWPTSMEIEKSDHIQSRDTQLKLNQTFSPSLTSKTFSFRKPATLGQAIQLAQKIENHTDNMIEKIMSKANNERKMPKLLYYPQARLVVRPLRKLTHSRRGYVMGGGGVSRKLGLLLDYGNRRFQKTDRLPEQIALDEKGYYVLPSGEPIFEII